MRFCGNVSEHQAELSRLAPRGWHRAYSGAHKRLRCQTTPNCVCYRCATSGACQPKMGATASTPSFDAGSFTPPSTFPFWFGKPEEHEEPEEFVIVPPIIPTDRQEINRMALSSYDWVHRPRELAVLLSQYLRPGAAVGLNLIPPSDNRFLTTANVRLPHAIRRGWAAFLAEGPDELTGDDTWVDLAVRAHASKTDPHSFLSVIAGSTRVRTCVCRHLASAPALASTLNLQHATRDGMQGILCPGLHVSTVPTGAGLGLFGHIPLDVSAPEDGVVASRLGVRFASASSSAGIVLQPFTSVVDQAWLLLRHTPAGAVNTHVTFGWQLEPQRTLGDVLDGTVCWRDLFHASDTSSFFQYQSGAKDSYFSVTVEAAQVRPGACKLLNTQLSGGPINDCRAAASPTHTSRWPAGERAAVLDLSALGARAAGLQLVRG